MQLPEWARTKKFWEAVSLAVAGLLALLVFFGKLDAGWAVPAAVIFGWVSALLKMFGVELELRLKALVGKYEGLVKEQERLLADQKRTIASAKPLKKVNK